MKRIVSFFAVLLAVATAAPAIAQVQTGSILIKAADQQGAVMPGVTITISSPVLIAGTMAAVTDASGVYRFPSLIPGTYSVKLELSGFQGLTREDIQVLVGQTTPVEFSMKVASLAENITVTGASPTVDTTSANVNVNLSEQLIQGTPGGRDIWALLEAKVPGLIISRPDVGGTSGGLQGVFSVRGTTSAQNTSDACLLLLRPIMPPRTATLTRVHLASPVETPVEAKLEIATYITRSRYDTSSLAHWRTRACAQRIASSRNSRGP